MEMGTIRTKVSRSHREIIAFLSLTFCNPKIFFKQCRSRSTGFFNDSRHGKTHSDLHCLVATRVAVIRDSIYVLDMHILKGLTFWDNIYKSFVGTCT